MNRKNSDSDSESDSDSDSDTDTVNDVVVLTTSLIRHDHMVLLYHTVFCMTTSHTKKCFWYDYYLYDCKKHFFAWLLVIQKEDSVNHLRWNLKKKLIDIRKNRAYPLQIRKRICGEDGKSDILAHINKAVEYWQNRPMNIHY